MKVLVIGGSEIEARTLFGDTVEVETMDANPEKNPTYIHDAQTMPEDLHNRYQAIVASHVLEHIPYWHTKETLMEWAKVLVPGGEMHVIVPSLEWAAEQILAEDPSRGTLPHLHGGLTSPWDVHINMFTLRRLRQAFEKAGLQVFRARTGPYTILAFGEKVTAEQHYICGMRPAEVKHDNPG